MNSEQVGKIWWDSRIETKNFKKDADDLDRETKSLGSKIGGTFKGLAIATAAGVAAAGAAFTAFGVKSVKAYNDSVEAGTKLRTNMLNVKGATDAQVDSLQRLASQLQNVGVIEDDVIVAGMSQLATFNLQSSTIEKLTPKITDMVAQIKGHNATAEDMVAINNLVGKVMTGNVGALSRYGVTLDENQKKQLENGTEAQKAAVLTQVLAQNYGEVNKALRNTPEGRITGLKNAFGDLMEIVGGGLTAVIDPVVKAFDNWIQKIGGVEGVMESLSSVWTLLTTGDFNGTIFGLEEDAPFIVALFKIRDGFIAVYNGFKKAYDFLKPSLDELWQTIQNDVYPAFSTFFGALFDYFKTIAPFVGAVLVVAFKLFIDTINFLLPIIAKLVEWLAVAWYWFKQNILPILIQIGKFIADVFISVWNDLVSAFNRIKAAVEPFMPQLMMLLKILGIIALVIIGVVVAAFVAVIAIIVGVILLVAKLIGWIAQAISWFVQLHSNVQQAMIRFGKAIGDALGNAIQWFKDLPGRILGAIGDFGRLLFNAGKNLIQGLIDGIKNMANSLGDTIKKSVIDKIPGPVKKALGISSPSRLFMEFGTNIVQGLVIGVDKTSSEVTKAMNGLSDRATMGGGITMPAVSTMNGMQSGTTGISNGTQNNIGVINVNNEMDGNYWMRKLTNTEEVELRGLTPQGNM